MTDTMIGRPYLDRLEWIARAFERGFSDAVAFYAETGYTVPEAERLAAVGYGYDWHEGDTLERLAQRIEDDEERAERLDQMALAHGQF